MEYSNLSLKFYYLRKDVKKMKNKTKYLTFCLFMSILCLVTFWNVRVVNTPTPVFNYKLICNIESIYYYLNGGSVNYTTTINNAAQNWVYTGVGYNKLFPNTRAGYISDSAIDFLRCSEVNLYRWG